MSDSDDEGWGSADSDKYEPSGALKFMTKAQRKRSPSVGGMVKPPVAPSDEKPTSGDAIDDLLDAFQEEDDEPPPAPKKEEVKKKKKKSPMKSVSVRTHIPKRRTSGNSSWLKKASKETTSSPVKEKKILKKKKKKKNTDSSTYTIPKSLKAKFNPQELHTRETHFKQMSDKDNKVPISKLKTLLESFGEQYTKKELNKVTKDLNITSSSISFTDFLKISDAIASSSDATSHSVKGSTIHVSGVHGAKHQFSKEETAAFARHINQTLSHDKFLKREHLPLDPDSMDLFLYVRDGILLAKLINEAVADTVDVRAVNIPKAKKSLSIFEIKENQNLVIESAKAIGCKTVGIHNQSLIEATRCPHLVLGIVWQIVKIQLMTSINLKQHPELVALLKEGEELHQLLSLSPEAILLRWVNYHLKRAKSERRIKRKTFSDDIRDSEIYTVLLNQIKPKDCDRKALAISETKRVERARHVLRNAKNMGVDPFIKPRDIASGNKKLNYAFLAQIFNEFPGLEITEQEAFEASKFLEESGEGTREERVFRMWMNSLGIEGLRHIQNLFEDCRDGLALLKTLERVQPGCVNWKSRKINKRPKNKYHRVENCDMCVKVGKKLEFSLVGIGGGDLERGNHKLTLALVWQMLRKYQIDLLTRLGEGKKIQENEIRKWANSKSKSGKKISSFSDRSIRDGRFLLEIVESIESRAIDWSYMNEGKTKAQRNENAKYVITCARKIGAVVFITFEDIVEVKPKMVLLLIASLMAVDMGFDEVDGEAEDIEIVDDDE